MLRQRKNKRFSYKTRSQREQEDNGKEGIESKWRETRSSTRSKGNLLASLPVLLVLFFMVLILMYILNRFYHFHLISNLRLNKIAS